MEPYSVTDASQPGSELIRGISAGFPIFIGYFPAAAAFGLIARDIGIGLPEAMLFSMVLFAGAAQFFALNLISTGVDAVQIVIGIILVNLRHLLMSASLSRRTAARSVGKRLAIAFGNTDEVFATASVQTGKLSTPYLCALEITAWLGWVSGTFTGYTAGSILPADLQRSIGITLYAMFAALLMHHVKSVRWHLLIAFSAAGCNMLLVLVLKIPTGWSFAISMSAASALGAALLPRLAPCFDEESHES